MVAMAAGLAQKGRLRAAVVLADMSAVRACLAGEMRRYSQQGASGPGHLVCQLPAELAPALVQYGSVQACFLPDPPARPLAAAPARAGHVLDLQILHTDKRVVLADRRGGLV